AAIAGVGVAVVAGHVADVIHAHTADVSVQFGFCDGLAGIEGAGPVGRRGAVVVGRRAALPGRIRAAAVVAVVAAVILIVGGRGGSGLVNGLGVVARPAFVGGLRQCLACESQCQQNGG